LIPWQRDIRIYPARGAAESIIQYRQMDRGAALGDARFPTPLSRRSPMSRRLIAGATTAAAILVLLAGCGGSSSSGSSSANFKPGYDAAVTQLRSTSTAMGTAIEAAGSETNAQFSTAFKALATRWQTEAAALDKLTAPSSVSSAFSALKTAATKVGNDLSSLATAASGKSQSDVKTAAQQLVTDVEAIKTANQTIKTKLKLPADD
jgi:hypothetical protein